jgi:CDP-diacylglycerol--inositol 3-phosphatidyltransferase
MYFVVFYAVAYILDALDGTAARAFGQCTRYGAALDMICDRASNAIMYMVLSGIFP